MSRTLHQVCCVFCAFLMLTGTAQAQHLIAYFYTEYQNDKELSRMLEFASRKSRQDLDKLRKQAKAGLSTSRPESDRARASVSAELMSVGPVAAPSAPPAGRAGNHADGMPMLALAPAPQEYSTHNQNREDEDDLAGPSAVRPVREAADAPERAFPAPMAPAAADWDRDGDVDLDDFDLFVACLRGPAVEIQDGDCLNKDLSGDVFVDLADFAMLQRFLLAAPLGGDGPTADAGGPYADVAANRLDGGWTFTFDGSGSSAGSNGMPIVSWAWDFGVDAFDGTAINLFKWDAYGVHQDDAVIVTGHGSQWRSRMLARAPIVRAAGTAIEATVTPSQTNTFGLFGLENPGGVDAASMEHGIYFYNSGWIRLMENGSLQGNARAYEAGVAYDVRIELDEAAGARYLLRESGTVDWEVLGELSVGAAIELYAGMVAYSGTYAMDDFRVIQGGETIDRKLYAPATVTLTVEDADGMSDTDQALVELSGPAFQVDDGGPYLLDAADRTGLHWMTDFDSGASASTLEIVQTEWDFGTNGFDGDWLNWDRWENSRAAQDGAVTLVGPGNWSSYFVEREGLSRVNGAVLEATVTPKQTNGFGVFGWMRPTGYDSGNTVHGVYFYNNGYIRILEGGSLSGNIRQYFANVAYDVRIVLKENAGARYLVREAGASDWEILADTAAASDAVVRRGAIAYSGSYSVDDLREVLRGRAITRPVYHASPLETTAIDAIGQTSRTSGQIETLPMSPLADAGGPYVLDESTAGTNGLPLDLDGSHSSSGAAIVRSEWSFGVETFDGPRLDERRWTSRRAIQNGAVVLTGDGGWGNTYLFETEPVSRADGASLEASIRIDPGGRAMIGFKNLSATYNYTQMPYALYFLQNGTIQVYEDNSGRGEVGTYAFEQWYDVKVVLLADQGATYWIRETGETQWRPLYASTHGSATEFLRGLDVIGNRVVLDNWRDSVWGPTATASVTTNGTVELIVEDAGGLQDQHAADYSVGGSGPIADAGVDIALTEADYDAGGWTVQLDGSASSDDLGVTSHLWLPATETFDDGYVDPQVWASAYTFQGGRMGTTGPAGWNNTYAFDLRPVGRAAGAFAEARIRVESGRVMWGLKNLSADYNYTQLYYAIYFDSDNTVQIYETGANRGTWGTFAYGVDYEVRIEPKPVQGARYLIREAGAAEWTPLYESSASNAMEMLAGHTMYDGTTYIDDFRHTVSGESVAYRVLTGGSAALTAYDAARRQDTDVVELVDTGEAPVAEAGGPHVGTEEELLDGRWDVTFDGTASTDDYLVDRYAWTFDVEPFDGTVIDTVLWHAANAVQDERMVVTGTGSWGPAYAFTKEPIERQADLAFSAEVNPGSSVVMAGFKNTSTSNFSYTQMPYAVYFEAGLVRIYENGGNRGQVATYSPEVSYDVRIVLKETAGARYYYSPAGSGEWILLYDSDFNSDTAFLRGITVHSGTCAFDDLREEFHRPIVTYPVSGEMDAALTVYDRVGRSDTGVAQVLVPGEAPVADAGGPYVAPLTSFAILDGSGTSDDGGIVEYLWDFGDGTVGYGIYAHHIYDAPGEYAVTLTVRDAGGRTSTDTTSVTVQAMAVCVPRGGVCGEGTIDELTDRHNIWDGLETRVKGAVFTDTPADQLTYTWNFGDGSPVETGTVTNKRVIEASHVYSGPVGSLFTATLTVMDPVHGVLTDTYPLEIFTRSLPVEVSAAVDEGLWYLHKIQESDGRWMSHSSTQYFASATASALQAFSVTGHGPSVEVRIDPYADTVARGFEFLFTTLTTQAIGLQGANNPDSNGNGIGITVTGSRPIYEGGMVIDALAATKLPDLVAGGDPSGRILRLASNDRSMVERVEGLYLNDSAEGIADVEELQAERFDESWDTERVDLQGAVADRFILPEGIDGRTYRQIVQDMLDQYAWGQVDSGTYQGGWRYAWNSQADNSACQWAAIGGLGARETLGLDAPSWVMSENEIWLTYSQRADGRFGYTNPNDGGCDSYRGTTASGMVQLAWLGVPTTDARWIDAEDWIATTWSAWRSSNNVYAWYAFAKAMRLAEPAPVIEFSTNGIDWYADDTQGLAPYIVSRQEADGGWPDSNAGCGINIGRQLATAWQIIILNPSLFTCAPSANAGDDIVWACLEPLEFNGCASRHLDPSLQIVTYEWDFDGDGMYDDVSTNCLTEHTYVDCPPAGNPYVYDATLRITDNIGQTATATRHVTIAQPPIPPIADADGPYTAYAGIPFSPDGSGSYDIDPGDYITRQEWDFDSSDGIDFDNPDAFVDCAAPPADCAEVQWVFPTTGIYNIGLRVWDSGVLNPIGCVQGVDCIPLASAPDFTTVTVRDNNAPVADAGGPYFVDECRVLQLDGSGSYDPDGHALYFSWDLDNDGEFDDATGVAPTYTWSFDGVRTVRLRVTDLALDDVDETTVTVEDLTPTIAVSGPAALASNQSGCYTAAVVSPCDGIAAIEWDWDYNDASGFIPSGDTGAQACHVFTEFGTFVVAARVTDSDGDAVIATLTVEVEPDISFVRPAEHLIEATFARHGYIPSTGQHYAEVSLKNIGQTAVRGPIVLAFDEMTPAGTYLVDPDGALAANGLPYIDFTPLLGDNMLDPGEQTAAKLIYWQVAGDDDLFSFVEIPYALNSAPFFTSTPITQATEGVLYRYQAAAMDPEGDPIVYQIVQAPPGMLISAGSGLVKWTPGQMDAGLHDIVLRAVDGYGGSSAEQSFQIEVGATNVAPRFLSSPLTVSVIGEEWCYLVEVEDPDGDPVNVELLTAPAGMVLDGALDLCWTPGASGSYYVKLLASDGEHLAVQEFFLAVGTCAVPPEIISSPVIVGTEGVLYEYQVEAVAEPGQTVSYSLAVAPAGMTIDPVAGLVTWTPGQQQGGPRVVKVVAADAVDPLCRDEQIFEVAVEAVNVPPVFESAPRIDATEGQVYQYWATAVDPDGDAVAYGMTMGPAGMTVDPDTGIVEWPVSQTAAADYPGGAEVALIACDPSDTCAVQNYTIAIAAVDVPPRFVSRPVSGATEGREYVYEVEAVDPDGDPLVLSLDLIPDDPAAAPMTLDMDDVVRWTPSQVAADGNPHAVRLVASAGGVDVVQAYEVFVAAVNIPPQVEPIPDFVMNEGEVFRYQVDAVDPDGDPLTYRRTSLQPSGLSMHPSTGWMEWAIGCGDAGDYAVDIEVRDGNLGGVTTAGFAITVLPANCGPIITSTPVVEAAVDEPYTYQVQAVDPEGEPLTCSIASGPAGMDVDTNCLVTWTPDAIGDYVVEIAVSDDEPRDCSAPATWCQSYSIHVLPCLSPPQIVSVPSETAAVANAYAYQIEVESDGPGSLGYEIVEGALGMDLDASGLLTWTPTADQVGVFSITVAAYAGNADCRAEQGFSLEVIACEDPPMITSTPITAADEASEYVYDVTATPGQPGDDLSFALESGPAGMGIDPDTGSIRWTPTRADVGTYEVRIRVDADRGDCRAEQAFRLTVNAVEIYPTIDAACSQIAYVGELYTCTVDATDLNGDALQFSLPVSQTAPVTPPAGMVIDPDSGVLSWTPTIGQLGTHSVVVRVEEAAGPGFAEQTIDIQVIQNTPPTIVSTPPVQAVEDAPYTYAVQAHDPDGNALTFSLATAPVGMSIGPDSGLIAWTPPVGSLGDHDVRIVADDGHGGLDEQAYVLSVLAAGTNAPPVITSVAPTSATPNCPYSYAVVATDPNGDAFACELIEAPSAMTIDPGSCLVEWTPGASDVADHPVVIRVTETATAEMLEGEQAFTLSVLPNAAPQVTSTPVGSSYVGLLYTYDVEAEDAEGHALSFELLEGPAGMTIQPATGLVSWMPTVDDVDPGSGTGQYSVTVRVDDGHCAEATQQYTLYVYSDEEPPLIALDAPTAFSPAAQTFPISVSATDNVGVTSLSLTVNGVAVPLNPDGTAYYQSTGPALYSIVATASDAAGNMAVATAQTLAYDPGTTTTIPELAITSPADGDAVGEPVDIVGTVHHESLAYWTLSYKPATEPDDAYVEIGYGENEMTGEVLGRLDPTRLSNGLYDVRLYTIDDSGTWYDLVVSYLVEGDLKIGNFRITYTDLEIPVEGLPISIKRTYDTTNKKKGDFGVGWTLDIASVQIEEGDDLAEGWEAQPGFGAFGLPFYIIVPKRAHMVNVAWPEGRNTTFLVNAPTRPIYVFEYLVGVPLTLDPIRGTAELKSDADNGLYQVWGTYMGLGPFGGYPGHPYNPEAYELTMPDGTKYEFSGAGQIAKLTRMEDVNGNTLTITRDGIHHSSGVAVTFERDAQGRITSITDPAGNVLRYAYDERGDLIVHEDAESNQTTYAYNHEHGMTDIFDPLGHRGVRNEYDDDGRLVAQIDAEGNRTEYGRDIDARQEVIVDRLGNTSVHYYDDRGNLILYVDPYGEETSYEYDDRDNRTREVDCAGRVRTWTYNEDDYVLSETNCSGGLVTYVRDDQGRVLSQVDAEGWVTTYAYDTRGNLVEEETPDGAVTQHTYDELGRKISTTNPRGYTEYFEYDDVGSVTAHTDFAGARVEYTYDDNLNRTSETKFRTLPGGGQEAILTQFEYDANNQLTRTIDPYGAATVSEYDAAGQQIGLTNALGYRTAHAYSPGGNLLEVQYPDGTFERYAYDAEGHRTSSTDRNGYETRYEFDKLARLTKTVHPDETPGDPDDNPYMASEFDCTGRMTAQVDSRGNRTTYEYPDCTTQIVRDPYLNETRHEFDLNGNRTRMVDALGHESRMEYDGLGRVTRTVYDDGTFEETEYDLAGNKVLELDQAGRATLYEHSPVNRLNSVILNDGAQELVTNYVYDEIGNLIGQIDAEGRVSTFEYDKLMRRTAHTLPLGQRETMQYDAIGQQTSRQDFNGETVTYAYDSNGQMTLETWPDGTVIEQAYLPTGERTLQRTTKPNPGGDPIVIESAQSYDARYHVAMVTNSDGSSLIYGYDDAGNRTSLVAETPLTSQTTTFEFDLLNRLEVVHHPEGGTTTYTYNAVGSRESVTLPNGAVTSYAYDNLNRLTLLHNKRPDDSTISSYAYTLAADGNRIRVDEITPEGETRVVQYVYDDVNRLVSEVIDEPDGSTHADKAIAYTYDRVGNRLTKSVADMNVVETTTYGYDDNDRLLEERTMTDALDGTPPSESAYKSYAYDANGNTLTRTLYAAADVYSYDYRDRLIAAENRTESVSDTTFTYDADGIRVAKTVAGEDSTAYLVDRNLRYAQVLVETSTPEGAGDVELASYVYGDDLLSMTRPGSGTSYYGYDGQMSTRVLTGALAAVTDTYTYDAFGEDLHQTGTTENVYRFTGQQYDPNLGFYYMRARYYVQSLGRFLTRDPAQGSKFDPASLHKYLYANASPMMYHDPSGETSAVMYVLTLIILCIYVILLFFPFLVLLTGELNKILSDPNVSVLAKMFACVVIGFIILAIASFILAACGLWEWAAALIVGVVAIKANIAALVILCSANLLSG